MRNLFAGCLIATLCLGPAIPFAYAQSGTKDEAKKAGEAGKEAGKDTADAAKHATKATVKATKKSANVVKNAVVADAKATCNDGTTQTGRTEKTACDDHGGVKKAKK